MLNNLIQGIAAALRTYPTEERRRYLRRSCRYSVYCLESRKHGEAIVADIGPEGLRIMSPKKYAVGQKLELVYRGVPGSKLTRLPRPKLDQIANKLPVKVLWSIRAGDAYEAGLVYSVTGADLDKTWVKTVLDKTIQENGSFDERRKLVRAKAHIDADMRSTEGVGISGILTNVSLGGALFQSKKHMAVGEAVSLTVKSHPKLPTLRASGKIVHHEFDVVSNSSVHCIVFDGVDQQTAEQLKRYVTLLLKTQGKG